MEDEQRRDGGERHGAGDPPAPHGSGASAMTTSSAMQIATKVGPSPSQLAEAYSR